MSKTLGFSSLKSFAEAVGIPAQTFYDISSGKTQLTQKKARAIQEKFQNVSLPWLLTGEGSMLVVGDGNGNINNGHDQNIGANATLISVIQMQQEQMGELIKTITTLTNKLK